MFSSIIRKISNIFIIMRYIWKTEKKYILFRIPEILLKAIEPFIMVIFPKIIIDRLMYSDGTSHFKDIIIIILFMVGLNIIIKVALTGLNTCITNACNSFDAKHILNIGKKIMSLEFKNIEDPKILDLFQRTKDTGYCENMYSAIANIIANCLTCIGLIAILYQLKIIVILVIFLVVIINVLCNRKTQHYEYQWHIDAAPFRRVSEYIVRLMHGFEYGKEIRIYNLEKYLSNKHKKSSGKYLKKLYYITIKFLKLNLITTIINLLQQGGLYIYLAYKVVFDKLSIGSFTMLLGSIQNLTNCLISISSSVVSLSKSSSYIDEFCYIMNLKSQGCEVGGKVGNVTNFVIEFKDVSFRYPGSDIYVLKNINVKIESNKKVSIVGTNGSGKTTFIKLILRLYEPTSGSIEFNGVNINKIDYQSYMGLFSSVFQDFKIFAYSMKENIAMNENFNDEMLETVVKQVKLDKKVEGLPNKLDTIMFKFLDNAGIELSGGEQQKLVIARALYKNCPVLILDEPTAALDPLMEYEIYQCINESILNKCVIFISHRLSITKYCDDILVFDNAQIIQQGSHSELIKDKDKLYYEMYSKQAEFYDSCSKTESYSQVC